ncbi:MAG: hypothetical protein WC708_06865 [Lentisphaeria bacterium]
MNRWQVTLAVMGVVAAQAVAGVDTVQVVADARAQVGVTVGYDPAYRKLSYIGNGAQEEDILFTYPITGHYRLPAGGGKPARRP